MGKLGNMPISLALLWRFKHRPIHKNLISKYISFKTGSETVDVQVRHLAGYGYNILNRNESSPDNKYGPMKSGYHLLVNLTEKKLSYTHKTRDSLLPGHQYKDGDQCVVCGAVHGKRHPKNPDLIVSLQNGHMDPDEELIEGNIIPMCQLCNQPTQSQFIYDNKGNRKFALVMVNNKPEYLKILRHT